MKSIKIVSLITLALAAVLAGCGGGTDSDASDASKPPSVSTPSPQPTSPSPEASALQAYCDIEYPILTGDDTGALQLESFQYLRTQMGTSSAFAGIGSSEDSGDIIRLFASLHDYRAFVPGVKYLKPGTANAAARMGIYFSQALPSPAIGCVQSITRWSQPAGAENTGGYYDVTWKSSTGAELPVSQLPGRLVDGFDFAANFEPSFTIAAFAVPKTMVADPSTLVVCRIAATAQDPWVCTPGQLQDSGLYWLITLERVTRGVHALVAR